MLLSGEKRRGIFLSDKGTKWNSSAFFSRLMPFPGPFPILLHGKMPPFTSCLMTKQTLKDGVLQNWK